MKDKVIALEIEKENLTLPSDVWDLLYDWFRVEITYRNSGDKSFTLVEWDFTDEDFVDWMSPRFERELRKAVDAMFSKHWDYICRKIKEKEHL